MPGLPSISRLRPPTKHSLRLLLACALIACSPDPVTELVVVVNSDMKTPGEFDGFRVVVTGPDGEISTDRYYFIGSEPGKVALPADFGLVPKDDDASRRVTVEVWATLAGADLFSNRAITGFVEGKTLRLDMFLASRCLSEAKACKPNETCRVNGCVPPEVDPGTLPEFDPDSNSSDEWIARAGGSDASWWDVAFDVEGNTYAAGTFSGSVVLGGTTYPATGYSAVLASFDVVGNPRWVKIWSGKTLAWTSAVATGADGRICVGGWFDGQVQLETKLLDAGAGQDSFVACFDTSGALQWVSTFGSQGNVQTKDIAVAPNGDVAAVGLYFGELAFEGGTIKVSGPVSSDDGFVARFDGAGAYKSARVFGGEGADDVAWEVAFDSQSNLIAAGTVSMGSVDLGGGAATYAGTASAFVAKYAPDGTHVWSHAFGNGGEQTMTGVDVGPMDRVVIAGGVPGTVDFGGGALSSAGGLDTGIAVFDAAGKHESSVLFGGLGADRARTVRFVSDAIVVAGMHTGAVSFLSSPLLDAPDQNGYLVSLASDLSAVRWAHTLGGPGNDLAHGVDVRSSAVVVAGEFASMLGFGAMSVTAAGSRDGFLLHFRQ